ncbi:fungal hydrophobin [Guyanagaster necrorhizus]|uniref:Hydrophobin n=1 Tax=Guyanagaster necrorhizus TaxID=856835 RepID=A0A9P8ANS0_9AGAR|nr:fungal hydrophobin [Guyanagaster necrorhizus MCA 3950]KAG7442220.1 fungal hydrophobin [Guyanagaster necrorhizus MCA 3950]
MFSRAFATTVVMIATLTTSVTCTPTATTTGSQCNTGSLQCCNSIQPATSSHVASLLGLPSIVLQDLDVNVGVTCSPITVIGLGGNSCTEQTVCCDNDSFNGVIALGCTPINVVL